MSRGSSGSAAMARTAARTMVPSHSSSASSVPTATMISPRRGHGGVLGGEAQAAVGQPLRDQLIEPRLVDRQVATAQSLDARRIDVEADHVVADMRQTGSRDEADVAGADDGDLHRVSVAESH